MASFTAQSREDCFAGDCAITTPVMRYLHVPLLAVRGVSTDSSSSSITVCQTAQRRCFAADTYLAPRRHAVDNSVASAGVETTHCAGHPPDVIRHPRGHYGRGDRHVPHVGDAALTSLTDVDVPGCRG